MINILTFNDLVEIGENERDRMEFVLDAIREHKGSELYKTAYDAELYYKHQNPTIMRFQKFVYNQFGQKVPDIWSPNNKIASNWYNYFTTQAVSYLLGNGVTFKTDANKNRLGKDFDKRVQDVATHAKDGVWSTSLTNKEEALSGFPAPIGSVSWIEGYHVKAASGANAAIMAVGTISSTGVLSVSVPNGSTSGFSTFLSGVYLATL